mgnify:FL=1
MKLFSKKATTNEMRKVYTNIEIRDNSKLINELVDKKYILFDERKEFIKISFIITLDKIEAKRLISQLQNLIDLNKDTNVSYINYLDDSSSDQTITFKIASTFFIWLKVYDVLIHHPNIRSNFIPLQIWCEKLDQLFKETNYYEEESDYTNDYYDIYKDEKSQLLFAFDYDSNFTILINLKPDNDEDNFYFESYRLSIINLIISIKNDLNIKIIPVELYNYISKMININGFDTGLLNSYIDSNKISNDSIYNNIDEIID